MTTFYVVQLFDDSGSRIEDEDFTSEIWLTRDWTYAQELARKAVLKPEIASSKVIALAQEQQGFWVERAVIAEFGRRIP